MGTLRSPAPDRSWKTASEDQSLSNFLKASETMSQKRLSPDLSLQPEGAMHFTLFPSPIQCKCGIEPRSAPSHRPLQGSYAAAFTSWQARTLLGVHWSEGQQLSSATAGNWLSGRRSAYDCTCNMMDAVHESLPCSHFSKLLGAYHHASRHR